MCDRYNLFFMEKGCNIFATMVKYLSEKDNCFSDANNTRNIIEGRRIKEWKKVNIL